MQSHELFQQITLINYKILLQRHYDNQRTREVPTDDIMAEAVRLAHKAMEQHDKGYHYG